MMFPMMNKMRQSELTNMSDIYKVPCVPCVKVLLEDQAYLLGWFVSHKPDPDTQMTTLAGLTFHTTRKVVTMAFRDADVLKVYSENTDIFNENAICRMIRNIGIRPDNQIVDVKMTFREDIPPSLVAVAYRLGEILADALRVPEILA